MSVPLFRLAVLLALVGAAPGGLAPAPSEPAQPPRIAHDDGRAYVGTVRYVYEPESLGSVVHVTEGTARFDHVETDPSGAERYAPTRIDVTWSVTGDDGFGCVYSGSKTLSVTAPSAYPNSLGSLDVLPSDGAYMGVAQLPVGSFLGVVTVTCPTGPPYQINHTNHAVVESGFQTTLFEHDPEGRVLKGTAEQTGPHGYRTESAWDLRRGAAEAELVVEPDGYATWLPEAGADEATEGNTIAVAARLRSASGEPVQAARFRFELVGTSREPGVSMNYPRPSLARTTPDLRLTAVTDETARDGEDGQWIEAGPGTDAAAAVTSFDWGGWTAIRVTATLPGGREVVGHLIGEPGVEAVPLPKRQPGSLVADAWKASVGGGADADDLDALPQGDGHAGDGLTLYQEYRGFVENGRHFRSDPRRKDLMVLNTIGGAVAEGVLLFEAVTGLAVHHQFAWWELDDTRVVNPNRAAGPHAVVQHGLWLRRLNAGFGEAVGGPGTPKDVRHIDLADFGTATDAYVRRYQLAHVAHELLHGVNVHHHGENDEWNARWVARLGLDGQPARAADGSYLFRDARGRDLDVRHEQGGPFVPVLAQLRDVGRPGLEVFVGYDGGQHSGDEACLMRYRVAAVSAESPATTLRYWNGTRQHIGLQLCTHGAGTGANAPGHTPRPRYGAATRGGCVHQLRVNDAR